MAKQTINIGASANDGTGDPLRDAMTKINENFDEQYLPDSTQYNPALPSNPAYSEGLLFYDNGKKALSYYNDEGATTVNIAQELIIKVYNNNGATVTNGTAVRLDGGVIGGVPTILRSQADTTANANAIGIATHDIGVGQTGYVAAWGSLGGYDTSGFTIGDLLYISATVEGELTNIEQPILKPIALVLVSAVDGTIIVSQKPIINLTAIGQVGGAAESQILTTTPNPLQIYNATPFAKNTTVTQTGGTPYEAKIKPSSIGASGFYEVSFSVSINSNSNIVYNFQVYVSGVATGVSAKIDLSNNNIDSGSTSLTAITQQVIDNTEDIEIYAYTDSGSGTIVSDSVVFSIKRIGNV